MSVSNYMSGEVCKNAKSLMENSSIVAICEHFHVIYDLRQTTGCPKKLCLEDL